MKKMTASEFQVAEQAVKGAQEKIARGELWCNGVQIRVIGRHNVKSIFVPGVRELVQRYLCGVTC